MEKERRNIKEPPPIEGSRGGGGDGEVAVATVVPPRSRAVGDGEVVVVTVVPPRSRAVG
jgi:hypothetical protein